MVARIWERDPYRAAPPRAAASTGDDPGREHRRIGRADLKLRFCLDRSAYVFLAPTIASLRGGK